MTRRLCVVVATACNVGECKRPAHALGMCRGHYDEERRFGRLEVLRRLREQVKRDRGGGPDKAA